METPSILCTPEQLEILNTGRAFASLEQSTAYRALIHWIEEFEREAANEARAISKSGAVNDAYFRASIRRDAAVELREGIQYYIAEIKRRATDVANELKLEAQGE